MKEEKELLEALKSKTNEGFEKIYTSYGNALYGVIYSILKETAASEDALQEVFLKIWNNAESFNPERSKLFTWMVNIARNHAIDKYRQKQRYGTDEFSTEKESDKHIEHFVEDAVGLKKLVEHLGAEQKEVVDMLYFKGYTQAEVAEELNIPLGTVKSRLRLSIIKLRKYFN